MKKEYIEPIVDEVGLTQEEGISCGGSGEEPKDKVTKPSLGKPDVGGPGVGGPSFGGPGGGKPGGGKPGGKR